VIAADAAKGAETVEKMIAIIIRLRALYAKLKHGLEKIGSPVESIQVTLALVTKKEDVNDADVGSVKGLTMSSRLSETSNRPVD